MLIHPLCVVWHWQCCAATCGCSLAVCGLGLGLMALSFAALALTLTALLTSMLVIIKKGKDSPYSTAERRVPELIRFLAVSLQIT